MLTITDISGTFESLPSIARVILESIGFTIITMVAMSLPILVVYFTR